MTFDLNECHHHVKLAPAVLLTKFGSPRALFNVFDPRGPRGPRTPYPCKTFVATPLYMLLTKFGHYYALRIFHVYKCTVNENTNKSTYWYTSHKSSIPGFGKPGIVAEICPSGFVHASYLPSDWLTLVWTHPLSQIGNKHLFSQSWQLGGSLHLLWFPVLFGSKVLPAQNQTFWMVPIICYGSQCSLAPMCFPLKINILDGSLYLLWFPVVFGS